jgi:hypothetical protein
MRNCKSEGSTRIFDKVNFKDVAKDLKLLTYGHIHFYNQLNNLIYDYHKAGDGKISITTHAGLFF